MNKEYGLKLAEESRLLNEQLETLQANIQKMEKETLERIEARTQDLEKKREEWERAQKIVSERAALASDKIKLNVGGQLFCVAKKTLLVEGSYFYAMLGSDRWSPDTDGEYFIDRDPDLFPYILTFLRTGCWRIGKLPIEDKFRLVEELQYYILPPLLPSSFPISLSGGKKGSAVQVTNSSATGSGTALSADPLVGRQTFSVLIEKWPNTNPWTSIGIATSEADLSQLLCSTKGCGLYIDRNCCSVSHEGSELGDVTEIIGPARAGKVIFFTVDTNQKTIQFSCEDKTTKPFLYKFEGPVFAALSPARTDVVFTLQ
jgi:hypothetical protein